MDDEKVIKALDILETAISTGVKQGLGPEVMAHAMLNLFLASRLSIPLPEIVSEVTEAAGVFQREFPGVMTPEGSTPTPDATPPPLKARWRRTPSPAWLEAYGGGKQQTDSDVLTALSRLRVLGYDASRDIEAIRGPVGSDRIERLEPVPGSERFSIKVGTTKEDAVTLSLYESDFDALMQLLERLS